MAAKTKPSAARAVTARIRRRAPSIPSPNFLSFDEFKRLPADIQPASHKYNPDDLRRMFNLTGQPDWFTDFRTIEFADHGQDFLWWTIDGKGRVILCGPFQGSTWCQCTVVNATILAVGVRPEIKSNALGKRILTLNYPITKITKGGHR